MVGRSVGRIGPVLALAACTWVTDAHYRERLAELDEDGDGAPYADDCDDRDPDVRPGGVDTPYDGLDQDCDGFDLVDADQDGFPGISVEAYEALGPIAAYPPALVGIEVDCADDPSVVPTAADVHPDVTGANEVPYDAIDGDCQQDNDFDVDRDGFMPVTVTIGGVDQPTADVFTQYLDQWGIPTERLALWAPPGHPSPVVGDCDDQDPDVHPENAIAELYYDGIDRDCDGRNDFDKDGDCFMPAAAAPLYDAYVAQYYGAEPPPFCVDPDQPFGDCVDEPDAGIVSYPAGTPVDPVAVHPNTTAHPTNDPPYDAIDADCGADNDFDDDHDGFMPALGNIVDLMNAYATMWAYTDRIGTWVADNPDAGLSVPVSGDCDDHRFDTWPGALDILADGVDQDCAGDVDVSAFGFGDALVDFDWTGPTNPEIVRMADDYLVLVGARSATLPSVQSEFGVGLPFPVSAARGGAVPAGPTYPFWKATTPNLQIQGRIDAAVNPAPADADGDGVPDPVVMVAYTTDNIGTGYTHLNVNGVAWLTGNAILSPATGTTDFLTASYVANGVDLLMDDTGAPFALACADARLHLTYSLDDPPPRTTVTFGSADACFFDAPATQDGGVWSTTFSACTAASCDRWTATEAPVLSNDGPSGEGWVFGDQDEGWMGLVDATGAAFVRPIGGVAERVFDGQVVDALDVADAGGTLYVAALVDGVAGPEVWLGYGPTGALQEVRLPFDDPSVSGEVPVGVAVYADADRVAVAVTATTGVPQEDSVGWVFLGPV
ncbi:MAG: MopE-related protein [Myxococcota bacterium]